MKHTIKLLILIILLQLLGSCSSDHSNEPVDAREGKISLNFDKTTIPENVVLVKATLTKGNYDPIIGELNLLNNNSAELFIDEIPVGEWNLLVEASDDSNSVLFSGETVINIIAGEITTVTLTLQPTGNGTGSVFINVNWGNVDWFDQPTNPLLESIGNSYDVYGVTTPYVIKDGDHYLMWYFGLAGGSKTAIFFAKSIDGLSWNLVSSDPVLEPGISGSWDSRSVQTPTVIKIDNVFYMYYTGWSNQYDRWSVGLATSLDGITWEKYSSPIITGSNSTNDYQIGVNDVIKVGNLYYLYYGSKNQNQSIWKIGIAISSDGINWTKTYPSVIEPSQSWEENFMGGISIVKSGSQFIGVYHNSSASSISGFGLAYSVDGVNWTKNESNPIFTEQMTVNNYNLITYPHLFKTENELRIYYTGRDDDGKLNINIARKFIF